MAVNVAALPTQYEYYTSGGIQSGLSADQSYFTLNGRNISIYSGAMHYFRTPKQLWRDRLRKMRAAGLNTVETYVSWNLHEPQPGQFDFGDGGTDMEDFLDIETFLKTAQEEDLFAIVRPGPYICAEWEFGGFPSWLMNATNNHFRTSDTNYVTAVKRFFNALLPILVTLQFINGGSILLAQVENEYASTYTDSFSPDRAYLRELRQMYLDNNFTSLLSTADGVETFGDIGTDPELFLITANFGGSPEDSFNVLEVLQPGKPKMAMEYYPGWFDHWGESHHTTAIEDLDIHLSELLEYPGSFNIYMFHGGTSFGFLNGANLDSEDSDNRGYMPDTTSYDYDSPLTEAGDYTAKYTLVSNLLKIYRNPDIFLPEKPELIPRVAYNNVTISEFIPLKQFIDNQEVKLLYENLRSMELLDYNNSTGQSYGYLTYRKDNLKLSPNATLLIDGYVYDTVLVLVDGVQLSPPLKTVSDLDGFGFYRLSQSELTLTDVEMLNTTLDLVVENWGRVGYGKLNQFSQYKGFRGANISIDGETLKNWQHVPLEFKKNWTLSLSGWQNVTKSLQPGLYKGIFTVEDDPVDTYIDLRDWTKGIVIVNGFVLGRYARIGPQQCWYLPAPLFKKGSNEIVLFEHYIAAENIQFSTDQIWETLI